MRAYPRLLDLYCCAGGAARGYYLAGFDVTGVDIQNQPRYPFKFFKGDALEFLDEFGDDFDVIHASPPCQAYTKARRLQGNVHPDLIGPTRDLLQEIGKPYVIENVPGAPLHEPIELCGAMFGLQTYRHRLFESNIPLSAPVHPDHAARQAKMGRPASPDEFMQIVGNFSGVARGRQIMEMPWATRDELREAVPPAYTRYLGESLILFLQSVDDVREEVA